jgi:hypothetical protein
MERKANDKNSSFSQTDKGPGDWETNDFIGVSRQAKEVRERPDWLASDCMANCILLTGESGVGKDLVANILQSGSVNAIDKQNMVHVDGGTLFIENVQSALSNFSTQNYIFSIANPKNQQIISHIKENHYKSKKQKSNKFQMQNRKNSKQ